MSLPHLVRGRRGLDLGWAPDLYDAQADLCLPTTPGCWAGLGGQHLELGLSLPKEGHWWMVGVLSPEQVPLPKGGA